MGDVAEDAALVRRIASRSADAREAEAALCRSFTPRAHLYGRKHLRDEDRACDLAQAVMLAVLVAARALVRCLHELDARGRTVVYLSFTEGRSAEQIAAVVETTAGNVRVLRHRAIAQLRRCIDDCQACGQ